MSKRKVIGIGVGMMTIGIILGICMMMFISKTNSEQQYDDRKTYGNVLEYEDALSQVEQENETLKQENDKLKNEKQPYAENAYNLGKAEYLALTIMNPEDAVEIQEDIRKIIDSDLTLEEQEKKIEEIFRTLEEYITVEEETRGSIGL